MRAKPRRGSRRLMSSRRRAQETLAAMTMDQPRTVDSFDPPRRGLFLPWVYLCPHSAAKCRCLCILRRILLASFDLCLSHFSLKRPAYANSPCSPARRPTCFKPTYRRTHCAHAPPTGSILCWPSFTRFFPTLAPTPRLVRSCSRQCGEA